MLLTVCSERSSYPCLCSGVGWKAGITFGRLMKFSRYVSRKRKIPPTQRSDDFVGWIGGKMNRVCCGAVDLLGMIHCEAVFKMNTTTSCGWIWTNPQNQWDLHEKYHCMWNLSRDAWRFMVIKWREWDYWAEIEVPWTGKIQYNIRTEDGLRKYISKML